MQKEKQHILDSDLEWYCSYTENRHHAEALQSHTFYTFTLPLSQGVIQHINGNKQELQEDMLFLIRPKDTQKLEYKGKADLPYISLAINAEVLEALFLFLGPDGGKLRQRILEGDMPPVCILAEAERERVRLGMRRFCTEDEESRKALKLFLRFFVAELLSLFTKWRNQPAESTVPLWLERACAEMREHKNFAEGLTRMIELSGKSREHLSRSMKKYKQTTVSAYINTLRLEYAAGRLLNSNIQIIDLCFESGFTSLDYFGKQFRQKYGLSPKEFRNAFQGK